jgi:hypothetical protein
MMTQEHYDDLLKAYGLIKNLTKENFTLKFMAENAWPDDWADRLARAMEDHVIQERVTVHMAQVLEAERRLRELVHLVGSSPEVDIELRNKTAKPH